MIQPDQSVRKGPYGSDRPEDRPLRRTRWSSVDTPMLCEGASANQGAERGDANTLDAHRLAAAPAARPPAGPRSHRHPQTDGHRRVSSGDPPRSRPPDRVDVHIGEAIGGHRPGGRHPHRRPLLRCRGLDPPARVDIRRAEAPPRVDAGHHAARAERSADGAPRRRGAWRPAGGRRRTRPTFGPGGLDADRRTHPLKSRCDQDAAHAPCRHGRAGCSARVAPGGGPCSRHARPPWHRERHGHLAPASLRPKNKFWEGAPA